MSAPSKSVKPFVVALCATEAALLKGVVTPTHNSTGWLVVAVVPVSVVFPEATLELTAVLSTVRVNPEYSETLAMVIPPPAAMLPDNVTVTPVPAPVPTEPNQTSASNPLPSAFLADAVAFHVTPALDMLLTVVPEELIETVKTRISPLIGDAPNVTETVEPEVAEPLAFP